MQNWCPVKTNQGFNFPPHEGKVAVIIEYNDKQDKKITYEVEIAYFSPFCGWKIEEGIAIFDTPIFKKRIMYWTELPKIPQEISKGI